MLTNVNLNPDEKLPEAHKFAEVQQAGFQIIASLFSKCLIGQLKCSIL